MSYNFEETYCCLEIKGAHCKNDIELVLNQYATEIWHTLQKTGEHPNHFYSIDEEISSELEEALPMLTRELWKYVDCQGVNADGAQVLINCEYDSERDDDELFESLCKHFFAHSSASHFIICSAAFDGHGGYSHQRVGYWANGKIKLERVDNFIERIFSNNLVHVLPKA